MAAFSEAQKNAHGNFPETVYTDSLLSYARFANMRVIGWNPKLVRNCGVNKGHDKTNNRIERANGTLRERIKVSRGWKSFQTQILEGMRIHYNFVKPHEALERQTPAQRAGIPIQNDWMTLLEQALKTSA
jgi:hypothetical protein